MVMGGNNTVNLNNNNFKNIYSQIVDLDELATSSTNYVLSTTIDLSSGGLNLLSYGFTYFVCMEADDAGVVYVNLKIYYFDGTSEDKYVGDTMDFYCVTGHFKSNKRIKKIEVYGKSSSSNYYNHPILNSSTDPDNRDVKFPFIKKSFISLNVIKKY